MAQYRTRHERYDDMFALLKQLTQVVEAQVEADCPSPIIRQILEAAMSSLETDRQVLLAAESAEQYYQLV